MGFPIEEMDDAGFDPADDGSDLRLNVVRLCGEAAAITFFDTFAGLKLRIPYRPSRTSRLAMAIGHDKAIAFAAEYGGEVMDVPMGELSAWSKRSQLIRTFIQDGMTNRDIARQLGCTDRAVRKARVALRDKGLLK